MADDAALQASESFYELVDGSIYDKSLLEAAKESSSNGEIGYEAAKKLWTQVGADNGTISEVDLRTMDYILKKNKFEKFGLIFLKEAMKLERQVQKADAKEEEARKKEELKAAGMSPKRSPMKRKSLGGSPGKTPKRRKSVGPAEEPYQAVLRITEELAQATSLTKVKTLQKQLEKLTPQKEDPDNGEVMAASPAQKKRAAATAASPKARAKGRGRGKRTAVAAAANGELRVDASPKKRPAAADKAPTTPPRKGRKQKEESEDEDDEEDEDEDDEDEEEEEEEDEEEEEPKKAPKAKASPKKGSKATPPVLKRPAAPLLDRYGFPFVKAKAVVAVLKRPAASKGAPASKDAKSSALPVLKKPASAAAAPPKKSAAPPKKAPKAAASPKRKKLPKAQPDEAVDVD